MSLMIKPSNVRVSSERDGQQVVAVFIANAHKYAYINLEDYLRVVEEFPHTPWHAADNGTGTQYVRLKEPVAGRILPVARLITGEAPRTKVCYLDGDTFNLRRSNLYKTTGKGKSRALRVTRKNRADRGANDA